MTVLPFSKLQQDVLTAYTVAILANATEYYIEKKQMCATVNLPTTLHQLGLSLRLLPVVDLLRLWETLRCYILRSDCGEAPTEA